MVAADDGNGVFQIRGASRRIALFQRLDRVGYRRVVALDLCSEGSRSFMAQRWRQRTETWHREPLP